MKKFDTYIEKLIKQLDDLCPIIDLMMDNSSIFYHDPNDFSGGIIILGADVYHWDKKDEKNQLKAREKFLKFTQNFELLLRKANPSTLKNIKEADKRILNLINQDHAPSSVDSGKKAFREEIKSHKDFLNVFVEKENKVYIIPDTNSIIQFPDPKSYEGVSMIEEFYFIILPTVINELDYQKTFHKNQIYKKKVNSVITRLKGYRKQGDLLEGVTVYKTITIRMIATEPNFDKSLKWLDPKVNDDRIIASALEIQVENPSDLVIFVTADINLQNKAQLANLTVFDTDGLDNKQKV
jgi:hypothetical protein